MRVFIVEDSDALRRELITNLEAVAGLHIIGEADSCASARLGISAARPDLVTLDLHLTDGSAIDLLATLKREQPELIVLVLTNESGPRYRESCLASGADYFLDKSMEFDCVASICGDLLRDESDVHSRSEP